MIILHICIIFLKYLFAMCKDCKRSFIKCISKVVLKLFNFMTLDYYIRNFLEISQFLLLSSINEIYDFNVLGTVRIISLTYAILLIVLFIFILLMVNYLIFTNYELDENQHKMFEEFFCCLQNNRKPRFYITMLLLRRCSFVTLLITLSQFPSRHIIGVFIFIQFLYGAFIILTRPYKETKCNFIEIINEVYFLLFLIAFIVFNTESEWSIYKTDIFIWTYLSNSIIVFIIVIVGLIKALFVWIKSKCQQNSNIQESSNRVEPLPPSIPRSVIYPHQVIQSKRNLSTPSTHSTKVMREERKYSVNDNLSEIQIVSKKNWD